MWTVVLITCDKALVDTIRKRLRDKSVMMRINTVKSDNADDGECYKVMVPYAELSVAQDIIIEAEIN